MDNLEYECIIIGGGIGGLLMSNMLAVSNKRVLLLEKNEFTGGYYGHFNNGTYEMDYAVSYFLDFNHKGLLADFFREIKLDSSVNFVKLPIADRYIFPDFEYELKSDYFQFKSDLCSLFPNEIEGIGTFFYLMKRIYTSFLNLNNIDPIIIKYLKVNYFDFLGEIITDKRLKAVLSARAFSADVSVIIMLSYLGKIVFGGLYQEKNHKCITNLLTENIIHNNGTVLCNETVETLIVENGKIQGVLSNGKLYKADQVISACDMTKVFCNKLKPDIHSDIKSDIYKRKKSLSSISLFVVLKKIPDRILENPVARIYIFNDFDIQEIYKQKEKGILNIENSLKVNIQHVLDNDFKYKENYKVRVEIDVSISSIDKGINVQDVESGIIDIVFDKLGFCKDDIIESKILFPSDFEDITSASEGAGSGWAPDVNYLDFTKYEKKIAENFYQTGCWDKYGSGIFPIYLSARRIMKEIFRNDKLK